MWTGAGTPDALDASCTGADAGVAVIGGGNSGVEAAIDLAGIVSHVSLLEFDSKLRADAVLQRKLASLPNVQVILNAQTTAVEGDGHRVTGMGYTRRTDGTAQRIELEGPIRQHPVIDPLAAKLTSNTYLGFDFGTKKIGIAVGQTATSSASPLQTVRSLNQTPNWEIISKLIKEWQPIGLVVGISRQHDGQP